MGNSFSVDGMRYLYDVARSEGKRLLLGNLYIGGCSLERHFSNTQTGAPDYIYYKNTDGGWTERPGSTLLDGLTDEDWDVITTQQCSGLSGLPESYSPYLDRLIEFLRENAPKSGFKLGWQMTWAYSKDSDHPEFPNYGRDQEKMYRAICEAVKEKILSRPDFDLIIPTGSAIQLAREGVIGDNLNRDGFHLNKLGRFIAGMTWYKALTGQDVKDPAAPEDIELPQATLKAAAEAACGAFARFEKDAGLPIGKNT